MTTINPSLLPNGLLDLLPPNAENETRVINAFMDSFSAFGYARVKPPLVEFEESLLGEGPGQMLARQTFRMMDPVSQRMMGVRADVTAQIARIATSRLAGEPRPLRFSYAADVLRVNGTQLRPERQFCQVGCEMIGADSLMADVETPLVALKALSSIGIGKLSVDLTVPTLAAHIYDETGTDEAVRETLNGLIEKRDRDAIAAQGGEAAKLIVELMLRKEGFDKIALPKNARADMDRILAVAAELQSALNVYGLNDVQITIDPLERRGFEYQTGVSFTLFAIGARGEIGRGGRYDVAARGKTAETATGFTLYMDTILRVVPLPDEPRRQSVPADASWEDVKTLQDQGIQVSRRGDH
jgi:ATP phosphoribosyltransferase regulatory subunit